MAVALAVVVALAVLVVVVSAARGRGGAAADSLPSDVVGRQRVLPLVVMVVRSRRGVMVMVMVIRVDGLVHVRVVRAAVLVESVAGVVIGGRRHPVQLGVQHVVDDGRRRPVVLSADDGRVHHHRYGRGRLLHRVMVGPHRVLVGRHGVRRQHGAAFPPEPPEPIARVHGQLDVVVSAAATATASTAATAAADVAAATTVAAVYAAPAAVPVPRRRPSRSRVLGRRAVGPADDRAGAQAVQVIQMVHVVQVVVVPRRYLVMVQLLMVMVNPVRGRIERHQTFCQHDNKNILLTINVSQKYTFHIILLLVFT